MQPLSPQQARVFDRLRQHHRRTGTLPDLSEFARGMGITYVTLKQHLEALAKKGHLVFESRGRGRSPVVSLPSALTGVPVVGSIPAGPLSEAVLEAEGYLPLPGLDERHFALRVDGESMADLIQPGDLVLLERTANQRDGAICAVRVAEDEVTLKYLHRLSPTRYLLRAHNPLYPEREVDAREVQVDGVYRGLLRGEAASVLLTQP